ARRLRTASGSNSPGAGDAVVIRLQGASREFLLCNVTTMNAREHDANSCDFDRLCAWLAYLEGRLTII
ncbi:MAG: hypothetical protein OXE81_06005, partial [Gammaproteobacteria bacterium]|nr:hypothetical protein [Gammaproteobacteria bacterium]